MDRIEFKSAFETNEAGIVTGIAWPFGSPDRVGDIITKGAFASASVPLPMLWAHDPTDVVGVWDAIEESEEGLQVKGHLLVGEVSRADEVHAILKNRAVTGLSIGFQTKAAKPRSGGGRTISALNLMEISLVSIPCHPGARVTSAKSGRSAIAIAEAFNRATEALRCN